MEQAEIVDPTKIKTCHWIYEYDSKFQGKYCNTGKWMLHYHNNELDKMWKIVVTKFRNGDLPGVIQMKCSTGLPNPRAYGKSMGMIMLYCNRSSDEERIKIIGKNIQKIMKYKRPMYYKTDEQTDRGTRATGQKKNSIYKMEEPGRIPCIAILKSGKKKGQKCGCKAKFPTNNPQYCGKHKT